MFEEPVRFFDGRDPQRPLRARFASTANYTFVNPRPGPALRHARVARRAGRMGARRRRPAIRPRRAAADGGLPDEERAGPAHQPGEARLLGGADVSRRSDSAAAGRGPRTAAGRGEAGSAAAGDAGPAPQDPSCAACHARFDSFGLVVRRLRPGRRTPREGPGRPSGRRRGQFPGGSEGDRFRRLAELHPRASRRTISSTISAANCWPTRWAAA